jgi:hypothetical protein
MEDLVQSFVAITAGRPDQGKYYLIKCKGSLNDAIDMYFNEILGRASLPPAPMLPRSANSASTQRPVSETPNSEDIQSQRTSEAQSVSSVNAFQAMNKGSTEVIGAKETKKNKELFQSVRQVINNPPESALTNYDAQEHIINAPSRFKGPDRLASYHSKSRQSSQENKASSKVLTDEELLKELEDLQELEFAPTKSEIAPPKKPATYLADIKHSFSQNLSQMTLTSGFLLKQPLSSLENQVGTASELTNSALAFQDDHPLFIGKLQCRLTYTRTPRPKPVQGDIFKAIRPRLSAVSHSGKHKLSKTDARRFTVELLDGSGLCMGMLEEKTSLLLAPLMDLEVVTLWVTILTVPPFTSPLNESDTVIDVYLRPGVLTRPIITPLTKQDEIDKERLQSVKEKLIELFTSLSGGLKLSKDVATKPLLEWKHASKNKAIALAGGGLTKSTTEVEKEGAVVDYGIQLLMDRNMNYAEEMECAQEPEGFSSELKLMEHQKYALSWLKMREGVKGYKAAHNPFDSDLHPMWCELEVSLELNENHGFREALTNFKQLKDAPDAFKFYFNPYSGQLSTEIPPYGDEIKNFKGGILADEMGLGKTVMMIALILSERLKNETIISITTTPDGNEVPEHIKFPLKQSMLKPSTALYMSPAHLAYCQNNSQPPGALMDTLVILPTSLIYQWRDELVKFSSTPISILIYSEDEKVDMGKDIRSYDVVLVSYNKLSWDYRNNKSRIHTAYWYRIILDEAHYIKNRKCQHSKAVCALQGERRWCLTGTPVQNNLDDLYSLITFLRYSPWSDYFWWNHNINRNLEDPAKKHKALELLSKILKPIMLRRTKQQHKELLGLKSKTISICEVTLTEDERACYSSYFVKSKQKIHEMLSSLNVSLSNCYMTIWPMLMKLRQLCDHTILSRKKPKSTPPEGVIAGVLKNIEKRLQERRLMAAELKEDEEKINGANGVVQGATKKKGRVVRDEGDVEFDAKKYRKWVEDFYYGGSSNVEEAKTKKSMDIEGTNTNRSIFESEPESMEDERSLTNVKREASGSTICPICMSDEVDNAVISVCGHIGCLPCLQNWLSSNRTCPICSYILRREDLIEIPEE